MTNVNGVDYVSFVVTGVDRNGKRFRITSTSWLHVSGINVWQGSKWGVLASGKRKLIQRISN